MSQSRSFSIGESPRSCLITSSVGVGSRPLCNLSNKLTAFASWVGGGVASSVEGGHFLFSRSNRFPIVAIPFLCRNEWNQLLRRSVAVADVAVVRINFDRFIKLQDVVA